MVTSRNRYVLNLSVSEVKKSIELNFDGGNNFEVTEIKIAISRTNNGNTLPQCLPVAFRTQSSPKQLQVQFTVAAAVGTRP